MSYATKNMINCGFGSERKFCTQKLQWQCVQIIVDQIRLQQIIVDIIIVDIIDIVDIVDIIIVDYCTIRLQYNLRIIEIEFIIYIHVCVYIDIDRRI